MATKQLPLWFGVYGREYHINEPAFFDDNMLPGAQLIKDSYAAIKAELAPLFRTDSQLQPYFDPSLQFPPNHWKSISFYFWGKENKNNLQRFPLLHELIKKIPGCVSASLSLLEPGSVIKPHYGETNAAFRVHLGVDIPTGLPECGFRVKEESRAWRDGELLIFLDANWHAAFNHSDKQRYILIFDVMRPEFMHVKRRVCVQSLSVLSLCFLLALLPGNIMKRLMDKKAQPPKWLVDLLLAPFKLAWNFLWVTKLWGLNQQTKK